MRINVTFRHMETSEPVRNYVEEKLIKVKKYIDEPVEAQVVLSVEKKIRHKAEVSLGAKGITIKASEETSDMYAAVDGVLDKLDRQLKRYKDKIKKHKPLSGNLTMLPLMAISVVWLTAQVWQWEPWIS